MKRPTANALGRAAMWLLCNNGDEQADCKAVAAWLEYQANLADEAAFLRDVSRETGIPVRKIRAKRAAMGIAQ